MSTTVDEIFRRRKHQGHTGGLEGCPLCSRSSQPEPEEDLFDVDLDSLALAEEPKQELSPIRARIAAIRGEE